MIYKGEEEVEENKTKEEKERKEDEEGRKYLGAQQTRSGDVVPAGRGEG